VASQLPAPCRDLLDLQHGVIARWQAPLAGLDGQAIDARLRRRRWQVLYRGVYAAFTGEPSRSAVLWGATLRAGPGATLSHLTAAELDGLTDQPSPAIHVMVSSSRRVTIADVEGCQPAPRIVLHHSARIDQARHPSRTPPRTRIEETTLDLTQCASTVDEAFAWLARACGRRLTTPKLLRTALAARPKLRWRTEISGALADVSDGIHSLLEWRYLHRVERPHGLPRAGRQARNRAGQRIRYLDNHYPQFKVVVELDGLAAHPPEERWRDIHRDNASAAAGIVTLRYSWADIITDPCRVAAEIAAVLRVRGWAGSLRPCGSRCRAGLS
jgi:hypothetical protein